MTEVNLLADKVLVKLLTPENKTGVVIVPNEQKKTKSGSVVAVGPGTKDVEMVLQPGDTILFGEYSGIDVEIEGEKLLLLSQGEVFMYNRKSE